MGFSITSVFAPTLVLVLSILSNSPVKAIELDLTSQDDIRSVASTIAFDMVSFYKGNESGQVPGNLPGPPPNPSVTNAGYFWWETGAMFGSLIDYWYYTGDDQYNEIVKQGMVFQSNGGDFLPDNQTKGMGNDDQAFWGMAAMTAAELNFTNPDAKDPQWLEMAQGVFDTQVKRFDDLCGGGLHWQAYNFLNGYSYKNSIANGCFFNIAARLAAYTGNETYAQYASSTFDWTKAIGLISDDWRVYDGTDSNGNCTIINKQQFSYNAAVFLYGAATMYNHTNGSAIWKERVDGLLKATIDVFFPNGIANEVACEPQLIHCTIDMLSYKAYLIRWMAASTKVAPYIYNDVITVIKSSAAAAVQQCAGSPPERPNGRMCGLSWYKLANWDGTFGVGQQMAVLEAVQSNLILQSKDPLTNSTGGTSKGNPNAGLDDGNANDPHANKPINNRDRAGAGILTAVVVCWIIGGLTWLSLPDGYLGKMW